MACDPLLRHMPGAKHISLIHLLHLQVTMAAKDNAQDKKKCA